MLIERDGPRSSLIASDMNLAAKEFAIGRFAGLALYLIENRIMKPMVPEFPERFERVFEKEMQDSNTVPILISSHQGHVDGLFAAVVSKKLKDMASKTIDLQGNNHGNRLQGFILPIAASIRTGHQGLLLKQGIIQAEKKYLPYYSLLLADYVRKKDEEKYGMQSNAFALTRYLAEKIREGYGVADFPEGSVQGGRQNEKGINGMQQIDYDNLYTIIKIIKKQNRKPLFIPMCSYGAFKIINHNIDKKTNQPANRIGLKEFKVLVGSGTKNLMSVRIGMPIKDENLIEELTKQGEKITPRNIGDYLGKVIANLAPLDARGVYA